MEWFESWFESQYYHLLYRNRDTAEAESFIGRLCRELRLKPGAKVLDLACGRGRHSEILAREGFDVTGVDISENSIEYAKRYESDNLRFIVHDMRDPVDEKFDVIFNLFTSFGYFEDRSDNAEVLSVVKGDLQPGGIFVLDFLNPDFVRKNLVKEETKMIEGVKFAIRREFYPDLIIKKIEVKDEARSFHRTFEERVTPFGFEELSEMLKTSGFVVERVYGDYQLGTFDATGSDRMIFVSRKNA